MSSSDPTFSTIDSWVKRLALTSLVVLPLALFAIAVHASFAPSCRAEQQRLMRWLMRQTLCLTPAGKPPRQGTLPHVGVDRRHTPSAYRFDESAANSAKSGAR